MAGLLLEPKMSINIDDMYEIPTYEELDSNFVERFFSRIKFDLTSGCWLMNVSKGKAYPTIRYNGRKYFAHRIAYSVIGLQPPEKGLVVNHNTGCAKNCCNPFHSEIMTNSENMIYNRDYETAMSQKLTISQIYEIKERYNQGESCTSIAKDYDISKQNVSNICLGVSWSDCDNITCEPRKRKRGTGCIFKRCNKYLALHKGKYIASAVSYAEAESILNGYVDKLVDGGV